MRSFFSFLFSANNRLQIIFILIMTVYIIQTIIPWAKDFIDLSMAAVTAYTLFRIVRQLVSGKVSRLYIITFIFLLLNVISFAYANINNYNYYVFSQLGVRRLKDTLVCLFPFFIAYEIGNKGELNPVFFLTCMIPAYILSFLNMETMNIDIYGIRIQNNIIYGILSLFPYLILIRQVVIKALGFGLIVFMGVYSAKRGAIIAIPGIAVLFLLDFFIDSKKNKFFYYLTIFIILTVLLWFGGQSLADYVQNDDLLQRRMTATLDEKSGRQYEFYYSLWRNTDISTQFIGLGYIATAQLDPAEEYAHNDFLEVLVDFGVLGIIVFVFLYISLFHLCRNRYLTKSEQLVLFSCLFLFFIKGLTAGGFIGDSWLLFFAFGYYLGKAHTRSLEEKAAGSDSGRPESAVPRSPATPYLQPQQEALQTT